MPQRMWEVAVGYGWLCVTAVAGLHRAQRQNGRCARRREPLGMDAAIAEDCRIHFMGGNSQGEDGLHIRRCLWGRGVRGSGGAL